MADNTAPGTLLDLLDGGSPSHPAIVVPDGPVVTYDSLRRQVRDLAVQLRGMGIERGDRVAIVLPSSIEVIISFLAVAAAGTAAPLNPAYKAAEFEFYIEDTKAKALITSDQVGEEARNVASDSMLDIRASVDQAGRVTLTGPTGGGQAGEVTPEPEDIALVLHTSGTTSRPKRVPLAHRNLAVSVGNVVDTYALSAKDVSLCVMPLFHIHGLVASTLSTFHSGGTLVVPPRFNPMGFWPIVEAHGATWFSAVPTMFNALLTRARGEKAQGAQNLRFIRSCSASLSPATLEQMESTFGVPVVEAYGMTEAAHQMASNALPPGERRPGSVGRGTGVKIGIMDEHGALQAPGTTGEVVISGPNVIKGYESNPEANASSFVEGWFRTGDQGVLDEDGVLTLQGRLKELINRSGEKISPVEIDEVLMQHPAVAEAVAFGVPSAAHGEEPVAAVVLKSEATERDLIAYCREKLAAFKVPRTIHIVDTIPRTATGKVQRRIVAEVITGSPSA
ncbi:MAG: acyl--CoA ligase [Chloroflexi bacterium]|nr:acyl--CoA ligase [Chloroflexota bacterium]